MRVEQASRRSGRDKSTSSNTNAENANAHTRTRARTEDSIERITLSLHAAYTAAAGPNTITIYTANGGEIIQKSHHVP